jgi:hypothetical protein
VPAELLPDRQKHQPALFGLVDDLESNPGAAANAIQEHVAVARLAHRARRHRADARDAVAVHDFAKAFQRSQCGIDRLRAKGPLRERVTPEQDAARRFFDDSSGPARADFADHQADRAGAHVENAGQLGGSR